MYRVQVGGGGSGAGRHSGSWVHCAGWDSGYVPQRTLSRQSAWFVLLIKCHDQFVFGKRAAVIYPPNPLRRDCWLPRPQPHPGNTSPPSLAFISWLLSLISEFPFWWCESSSALSDHVRCTCKVGKTSMVFLWWNQSSDLLIDLDYKFYK